MATHMSDEQRREFLSEGTRTGILSTVRADGSPHAAPIWFSDDLDDLLTWATTIGGRYMGAENAEQFGRRNAVPEEILVRLVPGRAVALAGLAD